MRWKFAPAETIDSRKWLLHFELTRKGVAVHKTRGARQLRPVPVGPRQSGRRDLT
jgi:hypothetical protein